jgi:hypothetical protein
MRLASFAVAAVGAVFAFDVSAQDTAKFMNTLTVCGMGSTIKIDSSLEGSMQKIYQEQGAKGKLFQEIVPALKDVMLKNATAPESIVDKYLQCVQNILAKS